MDTDFETHPVGTVKALQAEIDNWKTVLDKSTEKAALEQKDLTDTILKMGNEIERLKSDDVVRIPRIKQKGEHSYKSNKLQREIMFRMITATTPQTGWHIYQKVNRLFSSGGDQICRIMFQMSKKGYLVVSGYDDSDPLYVLPKPTSIEDT